MAWHSTIMEPEQRGVKKGCFDLSGEWKVLK
jgi:hypothetical protein